MNYASEHVQSDLDVSVFVTWTSDGKKKQLTLSETDLLVLDPDVEFSVNDAETFKKEYGAYLIGLCISTLLCVHLFCVFCDVQSASSTAEV